MYLLHRMGVEQVIRRLRKYSWQSWKQKRISFYYEDTINKIKKSMSDPEFVERFPNHTDRFVGIYYTIKEQYRWKPGYLKGIL